MTEQKERLPHKRLEEHLGTIGQRLAEQELVLKSLKFKDDYHADKILQSNDVTARFNHSLAMLIMTQLELCREADFRVYADGHKEDETARRRISSTMRPGAAMTTSDPRDISITITDAANLDQVRLDLGRESHQSLLTFSLLMVRSVATCLARARLNPNLMDVIDVKKLDDLLMSPRGDKPTEIVIDEAAGGKAGPDVRRAVSEIMGEEDPDRCDCRGHALSAGYEPGDEVDECPGGCGRKNFRLARRPL